MRVILASGSPRRKELLKMITEEFEVLVSDCEEVITKTKPDEVTRELALQKGNAVAEGLSGEYLLIGADTVVAVDDKILGKPRDKKEAKEMIEMLQGRSHQVYTGVAIICQKDGVKKQKDFSVCTEVMVANMTSDEVEEYISTKEPYDKAGAYGIQGAFGKYVEGIRGDYNNVVGLPVQKLYQELSEYSVLSVLENKYKK